MFFCVVGVGKFFIEVKLSFTGRTELFGII